MVFLLFIDLIYSYFFTCLAVFYWMLDIVNFILFGAVILCNPRKFLCALFKLCLNLILSVVVVQLPSCIRLLVTP